MVTELEESHATNNTKNILSNKSFSMQLKDEIDDYEEMVNTYKQ